MSLPLHVDLLWQGLPSYLAEPSTRVAVLLPAAVSGVLAWTNRRRAPAPARGLMLVAGTALSVVFSVFHSDGATVELLMLPGYGLLAAMASPSWRPHWSQVYGYSFLSQLLADVWCSAVHQVGPLGLDPAFYFGVGGAGWTDGLLLFPPWLTFWLWLRARLERLPWAHVPIQQLPALGLAHWRSARALR